MDWPDCDREKLLLDFMDFAWPIEQSPLNNVYITSKKSVLKENSKKSALEQ